MITVILKSGKGASNLVNRSDASKLISHPLYNFNSRPQSWRPPTDIYETDDVFIVLVEIAGMKESDFAVSIDRNLLTINGFRQSPITEQRAYHQMEIPFGDFISQIELPGLIAVENIEATYENGYLRITLPKEKPKQIKINKE